MHRRSAAEQAFAVTNVIFFLFFCAITIYPFINALAYSLSSADGVRRNIITFLPHGLTLENYRIIFRRADILRASGISLARTVVGTVYAIVITTLAAYALLDRRLPFRRPIIIYLILPMYVYAGLIPYFVLIHDLKLMNNFLVYVLPHGFWAFNMILIRTYMGVDTDQPGRIRQDRRRPRADHHGAHHRAAVAADHRRDLSVPGGLAVELMVRCAALHYQAGTADAGHLVAQDPAAGGSCRRRPMMSIMRADAEGRVSSESVKMATLIVATLPIVFSYPFFQRYFIKGILIGAVKE